jgi:hypothetical protein
VVRRCQTVVTHVIGTVDDSNVASNAQRTAMEPQGLTYKLVGHKSGKNIHTQVGDRQSTQSLERLQHP